MEKVIVNPESLPSKLENYDAEFQVWMDDEGCYWSYYFMNTLKKEHQKRPEKSILSYNGSSNTKNVPPPELHDAMINSSKPIRIVIHDWNEEGIGYFEQFHIVKHMLLDEKNGTKTLFNKHAEGSTSLGFLPSRDLMKSIVQMELLKEKVLEHEALIQNAASDLPYEEKSDIFKVRKKSGDRFKYLFENGGFIQGRVLHHQITSHKEWLTEQFNTYPNPEYWRDAARIWEFIFPDGKDEEIVDGSGRGRGFLSSALRKKYLWTTMIEWEDHCYMTQEDREELSNWFNRLKEHRSEPSKDEDLETRLYNKILKLNLLTPPTKGGGRVPKMDHPALSKFFDGFGRTTKEESRIKSAVVREFEKAREKEIRRKENSYHFTNDEIKNDPNTAKIWKDKKQKAINNIPTLKNKRAREFVKTTRGFLNDHVSRYFYEDIADQLRKRIEDNEPDRPIYHVKDLPVLIVFETSAKYESFVNGKGKGEEISLEALKLTWKDKTNLHILPIDPRVEPK